MMVLSGFFSPNNHGHSALSLDSLKVILISEFVEGNFHHPSFEETAVRFFFERVVPLSQIEVSDRRPLPMGKLHGRTL